MMILTTLRINTAVIAAVLVATGCSDSDSTPAASDNNNETSMPTPGTTPPGNTVNTFDGNWTMSCRSEDATDSEAEFEVVNVTISGDMATSTIFTYTDSACTNPSTPAEVRIEYSIAYPGGTTATSLGTATHVDVTPESATYDGVAPTAEELALLNQSGELDTDYEIFLIANSNLYAGDTDGALDGESAANRPDTLDTTDFFTRQ